MVDFNQKRIPDGSWQEFLNMKRSQQVEGVELSNPIIRGNVQVEKVVPRKVDTAGIDIWVDVGEDIQKAIDLVYSNGGGKVTLANGTHYPVTNLTFYNNIYLYGQNADSCFIDFNSQAYGIVVEGSNAYSTGTVAVTSGATAVVGTDTVWTSAMVGRYILLRGIWYPIAAVTDGTHLTLGLNYADEDLSGESYVLATPIDDVKIDSLTIRNSLTAALKVRYGNEFWSEDLQIETSAIGFDADDCSNMEINAMDLIANATHLDWDNVHYSVLTSSGGIITSSGNGYEFTSCSNSVISSNFILRAAGDGIQITSCRDMVFFGITSKLSGGQGVELVSGNNNVEIVSSAARNNTSDGIKLTATSDGCIITNCILYDNGGYGLNIAAATCDSTFIRNNQYSGNALGTYNDLGTDTLRDQVSVTRAGQASANYHLTNDTSRTAAGTDYTKRKEILLGEDLANGKVAFTLASTSGNVFGKVYKNGASIGTERSAAGAGTEFTEDFSGFVSGDLIQIYCKADGGAVNPTVSNFRIGYDDQITKFDGQTLITGIYVEGKVISYTNQDPA